MTTEPAGESRWFEPDWPLPPGVRALQTTRCGGVSSGAWSGFNLGDHVADDPAAVAANRAALAAYIGCEPRWLRQVHGTTVCDLDRCAAEVQEADAALARQVGQVCVVMTADCLPVLLCADDGSVVSAVHAGWRGLLAGVIEAAIREMAVPGRRILAWLGPAIGPAAFEVGDEVRAAFVAADAAAAPCFRTSPGGRWLADLYGLARLRLAGSGVLNVAGGDECTFRDEARFYSYRRDGVTGRMATLIWKTGGAGENR